MALAEAIKKPRKPPRLRRGNARQRCQLCRYFDSKGRCRLYNWQVRANQVSASFSLGTTRDGGNHGDE